MEEASRQVMAERLRPRTASNSRPIQRPHLVIPSPNLHRGDLAVPHVEEEGLGVAETRGVDLGRPLAGIPVHPARHARRPALRGRKLGRHVVLALDKRLVHRRDHLRGVPLCCQLRLEVDTLNAAVEVLGEALAEELAGVPPPVSVKDAKEPPVAVRRVLVVVPRPLDAHLDVRVLAPAVAADPWLELRLLRLRVLQHPRREYLFRCHHPASAPLSGRTRL
mmetsp:Transcript_45808/g.114848  ORF Transcript_45808/g.114848 Transcript_45808/m.114848 type:complete len:221 (-) Transcript_45808:22-684(-)